MSHFVLIALANAVEGQEDTFNDWYDHQHIQDVMAIDGIVGARRLKVVGGDGRWQYLTVYDAETESPDIILAEIRRRSGTKLMPVSDALDRRSVYFGLFSELRT